VFLGSCFGDENLRSQVSLVKNIVQLLGYHPPSANVVYVNVHILESYISGVEVFIIHGTRFKNHDRIEH